MWGESASHSVIRLTRIRSLATWLATALPTVVVLVAAGFVVERLLENGAWTFVPVLLAAAAYLVGTAWSAVLIYRL